MNVDCCSIPNILNASTTRAFGTAVACTLVIFVLERGTMAGLLHDLRYALRLLSRSPGFTTVAVLILALGIGANTAVFSVMNAALLRYLPVPYPQQLVYLQKTSSPAAATDTGNPHYTFSEASFEQLRTQHQVFSDVIAFVPLAIGKVPVRFGREPEEASVDMVSGNFFTGLAVRSQRGETFTLEDETARRPFAVLSYDYWTKRFGRDPSVIGQVIYIKSAPFTITGIATRHFVGVEPDGKPTDLWIPLQSSAELKPWGRSPQDTETLHASPNWWFLMLIGRLQKGMTWQRAVNLLTPAFQRAAYQGVGQLPSGERLPRLYFSATGGIQKLRENYENPLTILTGMVALVLLIACINVAMLLIARNAAREREFCLRVALGAGRSRLFRRLLSESLVLVAAGAFLAWLFASWATSALAAWSGLSLDVAADRTVLFFMPLIMLIVALALGLAPLRNATRRPTALALNASANTLRLNKQKFRTGQAMVAWQVALCLVLLTGAGLLLQTLHNLENVNLGFDASHLLVFDVAAPQTLGDKSERSHFFESLTDDLRALPGVESATVMANRIGSGWSNNANVLVDGVSPLGNRGAIVRWNSVGPDFCHVLGIPMPLGRDFTDRDAATQTGTAIINETFAQRYLLGRDPIGHQITIAKGQLFTIIGVAADSKYTGVRERTVPMAYFPYTQTSVGGTMTFVLRTHTDPLGLLPEIRRAAVGVEPDLTLLQPMTQQAQIEQSFSKERLFAHLATFFGLLAILLVATGLYGTVSYRVTHRTAEIGVRMTLGAQRSQISWMVLMESLMISLVGLFIGLPLAFGGALMLRSKLFGVGPMDPITFVSSFLGIALVILLASYLPARRAAKVDPMVALRHE